MRRIDGQRVRPVSTGRTSFYRLPVDRPESPREAEARERAQQRLRRQRDTLRPLGLVVIAAVAIGAINGHPAPTGHRAGLGVAAALVVFAAALAVAVRGNFIDRARATQGVVIAAMGAAGVALTALQPHGATELAGGAAVWMAIARLPFSLGVALASVITVGIALAEALAGSSASVVLAAVLLCVLLALVAYFIKQARASQNTTELLLAQLEDAREEQLRSAAVSERSRIASELHDVLAHALSGAAIQLQGARKLAEHEQASAQIRAAIERASELVRDGLANARQAVGALRGDELLGISQLEALVATFKNDMNTEVTLTVNGSARPLPPRQASPSTAAPRRRSPTSPAMPPVPPQPFSSTTATTTPR
jgi:signal transduction histidine kinase